MFVYNEIFDSKQPDFHIKRAEAFRHIDLLKGYKDEAKALLEQAVQQAVQAGELADVSLPDYVVEVPNDASHGDFATNLAMVSAKAFRLAPRKIAQSIVEHMPKEGIFQKAEVAGPGFINLFLQEGWGASVLMAACLNGAEYGCSESQKKERVNVEFVSANPTGPMHLGNARGAALGDGLAEALAMAGHEVCREFYINDAGNQVQKFGASLSARYRQLLLGEEAVPFPEDGYQGDDIRERAKEYYDMHGEALRDVDEEARREALVAYALPKNIEGLQTDLAKYRVQYDVWFRESSLHESGAVERVVQSLQERGMAYEKEGALWYKATEFGGEKDEVLVRANGIPTYFAADIAYHADKFERGFTRLIDVWGADHHGHVARMKGAMEALGYDSSRLEIVLMQFVRLVREGELVRMSKRTGKAITLTDLLLEVPIDSARFFFNMREPGSAIEFDLDLAVKEDSDNPVYYVQYAHARICSILRTLQEVGVDYDEEEAFGNAVLLQGDKEKALLRLVMTFPAEICACADNSDPARITRYLVELATAFHRFYAECRIKEEEPRLQQARISLCKAVQIVLANGLKMLKVTVPTRM